MVRAIIKLRTKISLVLIDSFSTRAFWYTFFSAALCRQFKIPYVPILHGGDFPNRLRRSPRATDFVFRNAVVNVSPSRYLMEHFEKANYCVKYIPNFIEIKNYSFLNREHFKPRLLWVRSFHKLYNPTLAIEVLAALKNKYPEAVLCMVGPDKDGSLVLAKQKAKELGVSDSITFTGLISKMEWVDKSREYDVFINTTNFDNMPISVIEAMALGLPVISTNVGGLPYLLDHEIDGVLVPPSSVLPFKLAIEKIVSDPGYAKGIVASARKKASGFDWSTVGPQWQNIITKYQKKVNG
jgi:L-malate glycosyltransferase